jgi:hypothetical protein
MPKNPRQGNRAEELGLFLVGSFAAVAPVPRTHDVGLDAVATLLKPAKGRNYLAEDSFWVQFKAASVREITYGPDEMRWLSELQLPLFIGSVNLKGASIQLFSCHHVSEQLATKRPRAITCCLNDRPTRHLDDPTSGTVAISLGPPVLAWGIAEGEDPAFLQQAYEVLKPWIQHEGKNAELRNFRYFRELTWETGKSPRPGLTVMTSAMTEPLSAVVLQAALPYLRTLAFDAANKRDADSFPLFQQLFEWVRRRGVEPDPNRTLAWSFAVAEHAARQKPVEFSPEVLAAMQQLEDAGWNLILSTPSDEEEVWTVYAHQREMSFEAHGASEIEAWQRACHVAGEMGAVHKRKG